MLSASPRGRGSLVGSVLLAAGVLGGPARAGANFPPVAKATASPTEVLVGEPVTFTGSESFDPDGGPEPLSFTWDFGDGATGGVADVLHAFDVLGVQVVTLTVGDGQDTALVNIAVVVLEPPTAVPPRRGDVLALTAADSELWVTNPDSGSVSILDTETLTVDERAVCEQPRQLAVSASDGRVFVTCHTAGELVVIDGLAREVTDRVATPSGPFGVAVSPDDQRIVVSSEAAGLVTVLDGTTLDVVAELPVGGSPRAVAITADGTTAYVTRFRSVGSGGSLAVIDLTTMTVAPDLPLAADPGPDTSSSGRGHPNLLGTLAIDPTGRQAWVGGLKSNSDRGSWLSGEPLVPRNRVRGLVAPIDVALGLEVTERRIDTNDADSASGLAFSPLGRWLYVAHQGAGRLSVYDLPTATLMDTGDGATVEFTARIDVGHGARGVAVDAAGARGYVANLLSRDVTILDLANPGKPLILATVPSTAEALTAEVALGQRLFHSSREPDHSDQNYIACASCHPDGASDGRTWDFTHAGEGLRNTVDLRGRGGMAHGPVHWSANFDEIQDFENDIVGGFGGQGLAHDGGPPHPPLGPTPNGGRSADLDALAAYVSSLDRPPPSPFRAADGQLTPAGRRGRDLFFSAEVGCVDCHVPPRFTDSELTADPDDFVLHDVGTLGPASGQRLGGPLLGLDTPTVLGVWDGAPYFHDGSATDLWAVVERDTEDRHGRTSGLDAAARDDLVAYLLQVDGSSDDVPPGWVPDPTGGDGAPPRQPTSGADEVEEGGATASCACRSPGPGPSHPLLPLVLLLPCLCLQRRKPMP